ARHCSRAGLKQFQAKWAPLCRRTLRMISSNAIRSEQADAVCHRLVDGGQDNLSVRVGEAEHQHFGHELADLARREIPYRHDLAANKAFGLVMTGNLRRRLADADLRSEIDLQLEGGLARFGEGFGSNDSPGANI